MSQARRKILVQVTAEDIANGVPHKYTGCPVALAVKRASGLGYVSVGKVSMLLERSADHHPDRISAPLSVQRFVRRFDKNPLKAKPFNFFLLLPKGL